MNTEEKIAIDLAPLLLIFVVITWRSNDRVALYVLLPSPLGNRTLHSEQATLPWWESIVRILYFAP